MHPPNPIPLLHLLLKVYNNTITDFFYFPEVIFAGTQKIERDDFNLLLSKGFITRSGFDSFGCYYTLAKKGDEWLQHHFSKPAKKKGPSVPLTQGCLYFNRRQNNTANGARCLLFL